MFCHRHRNPGIDANGRTQYLGHVCVRITQTISSYEIHRTDQGVGFGTRAYGRSDGCSARRADESCGGKRRCALYSSLRQLSGHGLLSPARASHGGGGSLRTDTGSGKRRLAFYYALRQLSGHGFISPARASTGGGGSFGIYPGIGKRRHALHSTLRQLSGHGFVSPTRSSTGGCGSLGIYTGIGKHRCALYSTLR